MNLVKPFVIAYAITWKQNVETKLGLRELAAETYGDIKGGAS